jgi:hypothetical protein
MLTPRQNNDVHVAIRRNRLAEQDFKVNDSKNQMRVTHLATGFYFSLSPNVTSSVPASLANAILVTYLPFKVSYTPNMLNPMLDAGQPVTSGASDWDVSLGQLNKWLAWIKREYGPFEKGFIQTLIEAERPNQPMNNEEIVKKQAQEAVKTAFRYSIHHETDKVSDTIIDKALRLHQPVDKASYFNEAIQLVNDKIAEHRITCTKGAGCPTEKKHEQVLFYLQQELDKLPKSVSTFDVQNTSSMTAANTEINKIFISHSSKDASIVEEVIDLLEVAGVEPSQIFCSSFEGYSIELGQDFLQRIKDELNSNILVLFIITANFYASPVSLCEMGAAWVRTSKHIPIVVPPLSYEDIKGVIPNTHALIINDPLRWNTLKEQLERWLSIKNTAPASVWERKRNKAIQAINQKIVATPPPAPKK